jgi:hypothetical protein
VENHSLELKEIMNTTTTAIGSEVRKTVGDVAAAIVVSGCDVGLLVMQAAARQLAD